jgi:hypothetical protein
MVAGARDRGGTGAARGRTARWFESQVHFTFREKLRERGEKESGDIDGWVCALPRVREGHSV